MLKTDVLQALKIPVLNKTKEDLRIAHQQF